MRQLFEALISRKNSSRFSKGYDAIYIYAPIVGPHLNYMYDKWSSYVEETEDRVFCYVLDKRNAKKVFSEVNDTYNWFIPVEEMTEEDVAKLIQVSEYYKDFNLSFNPVIDIRKELSK